MSRLAGKVALVTGGGTGIGRACALLFAREGAAVVVAGRRRQPLEAVAAEIASGQGWALALPGDMTRETDVEHVVRAAVERFGRLNVVVNNAGAVLAATAEQTTEQQFDQIVAANLKTTFLVSRAALAPLRQSGGGSIVNIGSFLGLVGFRSRAAYCAAKGGVTLLTKAMALDHAREGIRVNCICPGLVDTEMVRELFSGMPDPEAVFRSRIEQIPLGRMGQPEDVARLALFLASDESSWITGAAIPLEGGITAQ